MTTVDFSMTEFPFCCGVDTIGDFEVMDFDIEENSVEIIDATSTAILATTVPTQRAANAFLKRQGFVALTRFPGNAYPARKVIPGKPIKIVYRRNTITLWYLPPRGAARTRAQRAARKA